MKDGCTNCKMQFCYKCSSSEAENIANRGSKNRCKCGGWSTFCVISGLVDNIKSDPVPHDVRCGCPICPGMNYEFLKKYSENAFLFNFFESVRDKSSLN